MKVSPTFASRLYNALFSLDASAELRQKKKIKKYKNQNKKKKLGKEKIKQTKNTNSRQK